MELKTVQAIAFSSMSAGIIPSEFIKQRVGMFQIVNHGIPSDVISNLQKVGKEFFELPQEEKELYAKSPDSKSIQGYGSKLQKEVEGKKAWVDHLFHNIWPPPAIDYQFWPKKPPTYRAANEEYAKWLQGVADKLFGRLSLGLGLGEDLALGVVAHTDMSAITILIPNEVQGLQVFRDDHWFDVKYISNALVIHVGDQLEILSNGKYKAVLHRTTVNKEKTRMSWPVFLEPPSDQVVGPLPQLVNEENPARYKTKKYSDYVYCKLNKIPQ
ncbi:Flavonol synthase/flavanone 3-hydroxylase [Vitis vinifera]|uniref:Flavonol synthase/flavanone 3-hydroxylase n=1 Tax=Vitis vinifera TaxID=29760 RepID=A0A438KMK2_VITVI|nr:Flavonol synthase/flavanone 3-hydroxylase [Vitis vinifera]